MAANQIPRTSLIAVLIALVAVLLPHVTRLPLWVTATCVCAALWRGALFTGRGQFPSAWVRAGLVMIGIFGLWLTSRSFYSLEPLVTLLVFTFALKLIEMRTRRDVLVVAFIAYAVAGSHFLFSQTLLDALYLAFAVTTVTAALVALHQSESESNLKHSMFSAAKLLGQAAPLMLILFVTFPRLEPLWGVPDAGAAAKTGFSDRMSPGDVAQLAGSSDLAFRATFENGMPAPSQLYWRGLVFSAFDGRTWTVGNSDRQSMGQALTQLAFRKTSTKEPEHAYSVLIEPHQQPWLYALAGSESSTDGVLHHRNALLSKRKRVTTRFSYEALSWPSDTRDPQLTAVQRATNLKLPSRGNTRTLGLARQLRNEYADDRLLVDEVLNRYRQQKFVYTLNPGMLGDNPVDEFLFDSRRGFCEHYASSFTFLMRAAGIPARIVVGYQGGEVNPYEEYLLIHQYDAHAWAEVWMQDKGWTRVDPTAAVAPHRVEQGMQSLWQQQRAQTSSFMSPSRWRDVAGLRWLRLRWDTINYSWSKWVVNYNAKRQYNLLKDWLGEIDVVRMLLFVVGGGAFVLSLIAVFMFGRRRDVKRDALDQLYLRHAKAAQRAGFSRASGEGAKHFAERIALSNADLGPMAIIIATQYMQMRYNPDYRQGPDVVSLQTLKQAIVTFEKLCRQLADNSPMAMRTAESV